MIVVTTPTGHVGSYLAQLLVDRGEPLRVIARDPTRLAAPVRERAEVIAGSHLDPAVLDAALADADAFFLVVPPDRDADSVTGHYLAYAEAARAAIERNGTTHAVAITTLGGGSDDAGQLSAALAMDAVLGGSSAAYRAVAAPFFMENLLGQAEALRAGRLLLPSEADRPLPVVAAADLAAVAADLLAVRSWSGAGRVPVSSPDALTPAGIAEVVGAALDRDVAYGQVSPAEYGEMLRGFGLSDAWAEGLEKMAIAQNEGFYDGEIEVARGVGPTTLAAWCESSLRPAVVGPAA